MNAHINEKRDHIRHQLEAALEIIADLDFEKALDDRQIALLDSKVRVRDRLIHKLASRISELEHMIGLDEAPPPGLREAFSNF